MRVKTKEHTRTDEERLEEFRSWQRTHPFGEQDENGIDLGHLRANLRLTPAQRFEKHQRALALMLEMQRAGRAARLSTDTRRA